MRDQKRKEQKARVSQALTTDQKILVQNIFEETYIVSKWRYFGLNFMRGIFFGFGTVIGGTVLVVIAITILSQTVDWFPAISDFVQRVIDSLDTRLDH